MQRVLANFFNGMDKEQAKKLVNHLARHAISGDVLTSENQKILRELDWENTIKVVEKVKLQNQLELEAALNVCITVEEAADAAVGEATGKLAAMRRVSSHRPGYEENEKGRKPLIEKLETAQDNRHNAALATRNAARALSGLPPIRGSGRFSIARE